MTAHDDVRTDAGAPASHTAEEGRILEGVAHEIRNALFATGMTLEAMEVSEPTGRELAGFVEALRRQLEPLQTLASDLDLYHEPPADNRVATTFSTLLRAAAERCRGLPSSRARVVIDDVSMTKGRVPAEHQSLVRALVILLSYAMARSSPDFVVEPMVRDATIDGETPGLVCVIDDNGKSLRAEDLEHLFEPYYPRSRGGAEVRLATARRVIEAHGGSVHAELAPTEGTRLVLHLPLA